MQPSSYLKNSESSTERDAHRDVLVDTDTTKGTSSDQVPYTVGRVGFEPTRPCGQGILSPRRLPFRHRPLLPRATQNAARCVTYRVQEATVGIEPTNKGFADPCLTTWLRRLNL